MVSATPADGEVIYLWFLALPIRFIPSRSSCCDLIFAIFKIEARAWSCIPFAVGGLDVLLCATILRL